MINLHPYSYTNCIIGNKEHLYRGESDKVTTRASYKNESCKDDGWFKIFPNLT